MQVNILLRTCSMPHENLLNGSQQPYTHFPILAPYMFDEGISRKDFGCFLHTFYVCSLTPSIF